MDELRLAGKRQADLEIAGTAQPVDISLSISSRMDPVRDITMVENTPIDYLDFASPEPGLGGKIGLDATNKWPPETHRDWGRKIKMDDAVIEAVTVKWPTLGLPGSGKPVGK